MLNSYYVKDALSWINLEQNIAWFLKTKPTPKYSTGSFKFFETTRKLSKQRYHQKKCRRVTKLCTDPCIWYFYPFSIDGNVRYCSTWSIFFSLIADSLSQHRLWSRCCEHILREGHERSSFGSILRKSFIYVYITVADLGQFFLLLFIFMLFGGKLLK